ncbi:MAG TPA: hypothetical protein DCQ68_13420 [Chryseobacterium indologenes]|nr:hypothetical protein [Chryseobacterium indologenes]
MKIVSLVPSITEALFDLGPGEHEIIGRTKFCIHPHESVKNVTIHFDLSKTQNLSIDRLLD